jgi:hypothetical protein
MVQFKSPNDIKKERTSRNNVLNDCLKENNVNLWTYTCWICLKRVEFV